MRYIYLFMLGILFSLGSYAQSGKWVKFLKVDSQTLYIDPNVKKDPIVNNGLDVHIKITFDTDDCRIQTQHQYSYDEPPYVTYQNIIFLDGMPYYAVRTTKVYGRFSKLIYELKDKTPYSTYPIKSRLEKKIHEVANKYYIKNK